MARRILLGKAGSTQGFFVSKSGTDVISNTGVLADGDDLIFDSRVGIGNLPLKFHGEGLLGIPPNAEDSSGTNSQIETGLTSSTKATITHNLGYRPFCVVQWCFQSDLDYLGTATKMYPAVHASFFTANESTDYGTNTRVYESEGVLGVWYEVSTTELIIYNNFQGVYGFDTLDGQIQDTDYIGGRSIAYAFLIFDVEGVEVA